MNLIECIKGAIKQLLSSKLRTFLTMLGMFIGIGSVIMVLSIGAGIEDMMTSTFEEMGRGTVSIQAKSSKSEHLINQEDLEAILEMEAIKDATLVGSAYYVIVDDYKRDERFLVTTGIVHNMSTFQVIDMLEGRMITEREQQLKARVAVVSDSYVKGVLGRDDFESVLGREIELPIESETHTFEIVGVMEANVFPGMPEEAIPLSVYIPITVSNQIDGFADLRSTSAILIVEEVYDPREIGYQVGRLLDKRHATMDGYQAQSVSEVMSQMDTIMGVVTGFISLVAGISLLVGGIGIMNIMLVTVKERTREIGVRKAVGATNGEILRQFLVEAVILTVLGGIIGLFLGYLGGAVVGEAFELTVTMTIDMVIFAVGTSSFIGIVFGVYPARQASKLDPVEALRYE